MQKISQTTKLKLKLHHMTLTVEIDYSYAAANNQRNLLPSRLERRIIHFHANVHCKLNPFYSYPTNTMKRTTHHLMPIESTQQGYNNLKGNTLTSARLKSLL